MFFKPMTKKKSNNWEKGAVLGFYTYLLLLAINIFSSNPLSPALIFWSGLIVAFGYELILNLKDKRKSDANKA